MHRELLCALGVGRGLVLVAGPTGQGKTTAIEAVLGDPACPESIVFLGDFRGEVEDVRLAVDLARTAVALAVFRIERAAGVFCRMIDMGIEASDVAESAVLDVTPDD